MLRVLVQQAESLIKAEKWDLALPVVRRLWDEYHYAPEQTSLVLKNATANFSTWIEEAENGSASSGLILAAISLFRPTLTPLAHEDAYAYIDRAIAQGHIFALCMKAQLMRSSNRPLADQYMEQAAAKGCPAALYFVSENLTVLDKHAAAKTTLSRLLDIIDFGSLADGAKIILRHYQRVRVPEPDWVQYGQWTPTKTHQRCVPDFIYTAQWTWLLVAKRKRLCHYVALLVCSYIVTRSGWVK